MGMFDNIKCEVPLPDGWVPDELQTKCFGCDLATHTITKDGRFLEDRGHYESVPDNEREDPDSIIGCIRWVPNVVDANYHGIFNFYGSEPAPRGQVGKWHEYHAKFTDGKLVEIVCV